MNKKFILLIILSVIILFSGIFLAVQYAVHPDTTPKRAANSLVFDFLQSALPPGVLKEQILAEPISATDLSVDELELGASFAFRLEPDGIQFNEPINFSLTISVPDYATLILFNVSSSKTEFVPVLSIRDNGDGTKTVTGQISHFSNLDIVPVTTESDIQSAVKSQDMALGKKKNPYRGMNANELGAEIELLDQEEARLKERLSVLQEESRQAGERWKQNFRERAESINDEGALIWLESNSPEARPVFQTDMDSVDVMSESFRILEKKLQINDILFEIIDARKSSVEESASPSAWYWSEYYNYGLDYASLSEEDCARLSKTILMTTRATIAITASCSAPGLSYEDSSMRINIVNSAPDSTKEGAKIWIHRSAQDAKERLKKDTTAWFSDDPATPAEDTVDWKLADAKIGDGGEWIFTDNSQPWIDNTYAYGHARHLWFTLGRCFVSFEGTSSYIGQDQGGGPLENKVTEFAQRLITELRDVCLSSR